MKKILLGLLLIFACNHNVFAILPPNANFSNGLTIYVEGEQLSNGSYSPARINYIPRVDNQYFLDKVIHIKTKSNLTLIKDKYAELTPSIQQSSSKLSISNVRALFPKYSEYSTQSQDKHGVGRIYEVKFNNPIDVYDACREMMKSPDVEYACPVFVRYTYFTPNDPQFAQQYALTRIKASEAWAISKGNRNIRIAIIDSGTDTDHEDLKDNIADGGYDFVGDINSTDAMQGRWKEDSNPRPAYSNNMHGTHVAGCAAAVSNNSIGIASIGMNSSIIPIKCGADNSSVRGIFRGYEAILYAAQLGAEIINCSWGGPGYSPAGQDIINQAIALGSVVVVATGNDGANLNLAAHYPSNYENVISVGSTGSNDRASSFSNYGHTATVYAPGDNILSTVPGNKYNAQTGTSMSSPIVAGIAALVKSVFPNYTPKQIFHQLRSTSDNVATTQAANRPMYYGRANAYRALAFNNPTYPDRKIPGCDISEFSLGNTDALRNNLVHEVSMVVTNHLAPTSNNFSIKIESLDNVLDILSPNIAIGALGTMESKDFNLILKLTDDNPWFFGHSNLLITFTDGDYVDYKLIKIPIKITSDNVHITYTTFPDNIGNVWHNSSCPSRSVFWTIGRIYGQMGAYHINTGASSVTNVLPNASSSPLYAIHAFDDKNAIIGSSSSSGNSRIHKVNLQNNQFTESNISDITSHINDIYFFNENEGLFVGDPKGGVWGIATTSNAGGSWEHHKNIPVPLNDEMHYVGAVAAHQNNFWFGTTKGRIYRTTNSGTSWGAMNGLSNHAVLSLAFEDQNTGLGLFRSDLNSNRIIALTTNGGHTWTEAPVFSQKKVMPIAVKALKDNGIFFVLCQNGEVFVTHSNGYKWVPILSKYSGSVTTTSQFFDGERIRFWLGGTSISSLDIGIPKENITMTLSFNDIDTFDFGSVAIGDNKIGTINISNDGNTKVTINKVYFEGNDADDFRTLVGTSTVVESESNGSVRMRFTPNTIGNKNANLVIESDAPPYKHELAIKAFAYEKQNEVLTVDKTILNFDTLTIFNSATKSVLVNNISDNDLTIELVLEQSGSHFAINVPSTIATISPNEEMTVNVVYNPTEIGSHTAKLNIFNNDNQSILSIVDIIAYSTDNSSVVESTSHISELYPNPATSIAYCMLHLSKESYINASIFDLSGREIYQVYSGFAFEGENLLVCPVESIARGAYLLVIEIDGEIITKKISVE